MFKALILDTSFFVTDVAISVVTVVFRTYLVDQSMDHLSATLKRGGVKDLLAFFPPNKREGKHLEEHFKKEGLPQVADWWAKKQYAVVKEGIVKDLSEMLENDATPEQVNLLFFCGGMYRSCLVQVTTSIKSRQEESPIPESELIQCIWSGLMNSVDWNARPDQIEGLALREVTVCLNHLHKETSALLILIFRRNLRRFWSHFARAEKLRSLLLTLYRCIVMKILRLSKLSLRFSR